jgi:1-acyl-sn-glycerol-3-phosphate acyltransferase
MPFRLPQDATWLWKFLWTLAWILRPFSCKLRIEGLENIPEGEGIVLASNHTMGPDYVVLGLVSPRQINFLAKSEIFDTHVVLCKLMSNIGGIPVERGKRDMAAFQNAVDVLKAGNILGMFPEGTRSRTGQLQSGKSGTVRIAIAAGAPVVPAVVLNSEAMIPGLRQWPKPIVTVRFGMPIRYDGAVDNPKNVAEQTDAMMRAIAALLPPEGRGVYADEVDSPIKTIVPDENLAG